MKTFKCHKCDTFLGEMETGKIHKKAILLCDKCMDYYKTIESLSNYNKETNKGTSDIMDVFGDIFKKK